MGLLNADGRDMTAETTLAVRNVISKTGVGLGGSEDDLRKATGTVTLATGLVAYDLEAPSKTLYPVVTPIRNEIPRETKTVGAGTAANWRQVTAIAGNSSLPVMPWVPEGQRAARMSITAENKSASYVTIGLEADITFEAQNAATGFEDEMSATGTRLMQQTMILQEHAYLGGNASVLLGTPATPTTSTATNGGSISNATYLVYVFALTYEGYQMATVAGGIKRSATITGMDGQTYTLNGGSSISSASASQATTGTTSTITASTTPIKGAVAYAWYVGTSGSEKLEAITTVATVTLTALAGTGQAYSAVTSPGTDYSRNTSAFDGLLYAAWASSSAYYRALANGSTLTASGRGTITEIDVALKAFWDNYRLSPTSIWVSSQELGNIYSKCFANGSNPLVRFSIDSNTQQPKFTAGQVLGWYLNPYSLDGGISIPIRLHPTIPAGTILFWCQDLPAQYQASNVPVVAKVKCRRDMYQIPWPIITRSNATGVYSEEVLQIYAPFALGTITNITNG